MEMQNTNHRRFVACLFLIACCINSTSNAQEAKSSRRTTPSPPAKKANADIDEEKKGTEAVPANSIAIDLAPDQKSSRRPLPQAPKSNDNKEKAPQASQAAQQMPARHAAPATTQAIKENPPKETKVPGQPQQAANKPPVMQGTLIVGQQPIRNRQIETVQHQELSNLNSSRQHTAPKQHMGQPLGRSQPAVNTPTTAVAPVPKFVEHVPSRQFGVAKVSQQEVQSSMPPIVSADQKPIANKPKAFVSPEKFMRNEPDNAMTLGTDALVDPGKFLSAPRNVAPERFASNVPHIDPRHVPSLDRPKNLNPPKTYYERQEDTQPRQPDPAIVRQRQEVDAKRAQDREAYLQMLHRPIDSFPVQKTVYMTKGDGSAFAPENQPDVKSLYLVNFNNFNSRPAYPSPLRHDGFGIPWYETSSVWKSPDLAYQPLYFEDPNLERYGAERRLQPVLSGAHFFKSIVTLPYQMGVDSRCELQYASGWGRPGDQNCIYHRRLPFSARGGLLQALAITGLVFGLP